MNNKSDSTAWHCLLGALIAAVLVAWFSRYIQTTSFDLVQHFLLVDELDKYHGVREGTLQRIGSMAIYPPISHWLAVVAGWVFGSGLIGITVVTVLAAFLVYVLIICLAGASSLKRVLLFACAFLIGTFSKSQIGWEVVDNFFYPQLVADVVYFGALLWASRNIGERKETALFLLGGWLTMWIQPLVAIHVFAAGCALLSFRLLTNLARDKTPIKSTFVCLVILSVGAAIIVLTNPAFKVMRDISANNGSLTFGYNSIYTVSFICAAFGAWNLKRYWSGKAVYVDAVLGTAVVAAFGLVLLQYALLKLHGDGSPYAVKKHLFIVSTLGALNAVRVFASYVPFGEKTVRGGLVAPILAGLASLFILKGLVVPVAPFIEALSYGNQVIRDKSNGFAPGNTVSVEPSIPMMANVMVSLTAFQHPFNARAIGWQEGASIIDGADRVMLRQSERVSRLCGLPSTSNGSYVVIKSGCLTGYSPGEMLTFSPGVLGWQYAVSGWYAAEPWGAWTQGNVGGVLKLPVPAGKYRLSVEGRVYVTERHPAQSIVVEVNGKDIATWDFNLTSPIGTKSVDIPEAMTKDGLLQIALKAPGAVSPAQMGQSADARVLGMGVQSMTLDAAP